MEENYQHSFSDFLIINDFNVFVLIEHEQVCKEIKELNFFTKLRKIYSFLTLVFQILPNFFKSIKTRRKSRLLKTLCFLVLFWCLIKIGMNINKVNINSGVKIYQDYDLMKEALISQNVSKFSITCNSNSNKRGQFLNYELFEQLYLFNYLSVSSSDYIFKKYKNLKFCTLNKYQKNFESKSIFNDSNFNFKILLTRKEELTFNQSSKMNLVSNLKLGGYWKPPVCLQEFLYKKADENILAQAKQMIDHFRKNKNTDLNLLSSNLEGLLEKSSDSLVKFINSKNKDLTVIIVPYLNRENNLIDLMYNLHPFLQRQFLHYRIVLAEQVNSNDPFNKGRLYNKAFEYVIKSKKNFKIKCIILQDVDLIPESDYNLYGCDGEEPRHLSLSIRYETKMYEPSSYEFLVGGVLCIRPEVYQMINGFSNEYWNWGAEDDGKKLDLFSY